MTLLDRQLNSPYLWSLVRIHSFLFSLIFVESKWHMPGLLHNALKIKKKCNFMKSHYLPFAFKVKINNVFFFRMEWRKFSKILLFEVIIHPLIRTIVIALDHCTTFPYLEHCVLSRTIRGYFIYIVILST